MAKNTKFTSSQQSKLLVGVLLLVAAYLLGSRALDTGSWQQYAMTIFLVGFGLSRLLKAITHKGGK